MSKKLKKNEEYPMPEGCIAIQIRNANVDYRMERELVTYPSIFRKDLIDDYCCQHTINTAFRLDANTQYDVLFLTGNPSEHFPSLNGKNVLIIITDNEEE